MNPISENPNHHFDTPRKITIDIVRQIRDLNPLDERMIQSICNMTHEDKMEIIVALNELVNSLKYILD